MRKITEILSNSDANTVHTLLTARKLPFHCSFEELMRQWDPYKHDVFDEDKRKKKKIKVPTGQKDPTDGSPIYKDVFVDRVRIALPSQKVVVNRIVGFMLTNPVTYRANSHGVVLKTLDNKQQQLYDAIMHCYHDNKMKYFDKKLVRTVSSQCEAAELWYMTTDENGRLGGEIRVQLLSPQNGDKLYPHFNDQKRMDGFGREYLVFDELGTSELHFDVYTDRYVYKYINNGSGWVIYEARAHGFTKIPVVYYYQYKSEWADVQWAADRVEVCISNWGDTNDYFGTPKYFYTTKNIYHVTLCYNNQLFIRILYNNSDMIKYYMVYRFYIFLLHINCTHTKQNVTLQTITTKSNILWHEKNFIKHRKN